MFLMIFLLAEVKAAKKILDEVKAELKSNDVPYQDVETGIMMVENAHKHGAWAGICGELGADLTLIRTFLEMGLDELSVSPFFILPVRNEVCGI